MAVVILTIPFVLLELEVQLQRWTDESPWKLAHNLTADLRHYADEGEQRDDVTARLVRKVN